MDAASVSSLLPSVASRDGTLSCQQVIVIEASQESARSLDGQLDTDHAVDCNKENQEPKEDEERHEPEHSELSPKTCAYPIAEAHGDGTTPSDDQIAVAGTEFTTGAVSHQLTCIYAAHNSVLDLEIGLNGAQENPGVALGDSEGRTALHASGNHDTLEKLDLEKGSNGTQERQTTVLVSEKGKAGAHKKMGRASSYVDKVCRVCHLGFDIQLGSGAVIELGCACKNDLAVAHRSCAEAWFKIKGNRTCEICGSTVRNVAGIGDAAFMENWNDRNASTAAAEDTRCCQNHRLFNFLLACMVFAFVIPWLFHVTTIFDLP